MKVGVVTDKHTSVHMKLITCAHWWDLILNDVKNKNGRDSLGLCTEWYWER